MQALFLDPHPCNALLLVEIFFILEVKKLAVQGQGKEGNVSTSCECCGIDMYIHDMYLSSNMTQWNVANCMVFSIPQLPISSVKSSCIKGELKQTAPEV